MRYGGVTVAALIEELQALAEDMGEEWAQETEVRIGSQRNYPFEYSIQGYQTRQVIEENKPCEVCHNAGPDCICGRDAEDAQPAGTWEGDDVVYLLEGQQLGYFDKEAWEDARPIGW